MNLLSQPIEFSTNRKRPSRTSTEPPALEEGTLNGHLLIHASKLRACENSWAEKHPVGSTKGVHISVKVNP